MSWELANPPEDALVRWIEASLVTGSHRLARGYQGQALLYADDSIRLVIKAPTGRGLMLWLSRLMLRHEARVYERLQNFTGAPRCYGFLRGRYLILEHVLGVSIRHAEIADRPGFFAELLDRIHELHARGIAHSDLQKKENLLVTGDGRPCLLDYGAAVIHKPGFAPFNHLRYRFAERLDFNQWAKLKYRGRFADMTESDRVYYRRTAVEKLARGAKRVYRRVRAGLGLG